MFKRLPCLAAAMLCAILAFCSLTVLADPETGSHALADKIAKAHQSGEQFTEATLFAPAIAPKHSTALDEETILRPLSEAVASLFATHPEGLSVTVHTEAGKAYTLEMLRSY